MVISIVDRAVSRAIHFFSARTSKHVQYFLLLHQFDRLVSRPIFFFSTFFHLFFFSCCLSVCLFFFRLSPKRVTWVKKSWRRGAEIRKLLQTTANETGRREGGNCGKPEYGFQRPSTAARWDGRRGDAVNSSLPPLRTVSNLQTVRREVRGDWYNRTN